MVGSLKSAWAIEVAALARKGRRWWSPRNNILNAWALTVVLFGSVIAIFGTSIIPFLAIQAVFGFSLLEVVNYIEHYGLLRQQLPNGRYESASPNTAGTPTTSPPTWCSTTCSGIRTITPTRCGATSRCAISTRPPAAVGLRRHDRHGCGAATVATGHGPAGVGPLRRRHHPGQHSSPQTGQGDGSLRRRSGFLAGVEDGSQRGVGQPGQDVLAHQFALVTVGIARQDEGVDAKVAVGGQLGHHLVGVAHDRSTTA